MKLFLSIYLILSHLFSTVGLNIDVHSCAGERSFSLLSVPFGSVCSCNHSLESSKKKCCENKKLEVKSQRNEFITCNHVIIQQPVQAVDIQRSSFTLSIKKFVSEPNALVLSVEDPPDYSPPLFIRYQHLLI